MNGEHELARRTQRDKDKAAAKADSSELPAEDGAHTDDAKFVADVPTPPRPPTVATPDLPVDARQLPMLTKDGKWVQLFDADRSEM